MIASPDGSPMESPLEIERVEWLPSTPEALEVRVCGRWRGPAPSEPVELVLDAGGERRRFPSAGAATVAAGLWQARFAVPVELRSALAARLALAAGGRELALPAALPGPADGTPAPPPATVVDPGVLASRRAWREGEPTRGCCAGREARGGDRGDASRHPARSSRGRVCATRWPSATGSAPGYRPPSSGPRPSGAMRSEVQDERVAAQAEAERSVRALSARAGG
ncbi:MAG: hypothetical protein R2736_17860 [Solirubrobacterales bacterium]